MSDFNSSSWVADRTTKELLVLLDLFTCLTKPADMPSNDRRLNRIAQVKRELQVRQGRQLYFMDRIDGKEVKP